jgi:hypothetical protein
VGCLLSIEDLEKHLNDFELKFKGETLGFTIGSSTYYEYSSDYYLTPIRAGINLKYFGVIVRNVETAIKIAKLIDGRFKYVFVDSEKKINSRDYGKNDVGNIEKGVEPYLKNSTLLTYKGNDLTAHATDALIRTILPNLTGEKIAVTGIGNLGAKIALSLVERGNYVTINSRNINHAASISNYINAVKPMGTLGKCDFSSDLESAVKGAGLLVASSNRKDFIGLSDISGMKPFIGLSTPIFFDVGKGCFRADLLSQTNLKIFRIDVENFLTSEIDNLINLRKNIGIRDKRVLVNGKTLVRVGLVGNREDIIVDNPDKPSKIIGVCDGQGNVTPPTLILTKFEMDLILGLEF